VTTLQITAKGQVTLKKEILAHLGVGPGDQVDVDVTARGVTLLPKRRTGSIDTFVGMLADVPHRLTTEQMNEIIADSWAGR
jgi:AbrB family looped-hinge helix DNA binding protein